MKFKVDENLPVDVAVKLMEAGHDAATVTEEGIGGATDPLLYEACQREGRILVTLDLDFANVQAYPPSESMGLIVLRVGQQDRSHVLRIVASVLPELERESPEKSLWIVEEGRIRIRF
jgi:predicted nuclease of predicted toxin-antitoxin system